MALAEKQQQLIEDYSIIEDPVERFAAIVDLGKKVHPISDEDRVDANLVPGCTSQVWMTGTELAPFSDIEAEAAIWKVSGGSLERL